MCQRINKLIGFLFDMKTITGLFLGLEIGLLFNAWNSYNRDLGFVEVAVTSMTAIIAILSAAAAVKHQKDVQRTEKEGQQLKAQINAIPAILSLREHLDKLFGYYISPSDATRQEVSDYRFEDVSILVEVAETGSKEHRTMIRGIVSRLQITQSRYKHHSQADALNLIELFDANDHVRTFPNGQDELETFSKRLYDLLDIYLARSALGILLMEFRNDTNKDYRETFSNKLRWDLYSKLREDSKPLSIFIERELSRKFWDKVAELNAPFAKEL